MSIDKESFNHLMTHANTTDKARLLCCSMSNAAGAWIRALPTARNKLSPIEWTISMKRWLGIPVFNQDHLCCACNNQAMDKFGHHAAVCPVSGDRIKRHNAI